MINNKKKVSGVPVLTALALATLLTTQGVMAADVSFNLTAQPLANAITQVAQQGQLHVIFDESDVRNLRAPALSGNYSAQGALQQLLAGSGLELVASGKGYVVRPMLVSGAAAGSMVLPTTSVMGEAGGRAAVDNVMSAPQVVTSEEIRQRPTGNGNITELLRTNPAVQFSNSDNTSLTQGEIKPGAISIHGSSSYQNAYNLDGVSFNNDIDPASDGNGETITRIDSSDQGMYIDSRLIDSVTVFDNNIPVEFGGFTGGTLMSLVAVGVARTAPMLFTGKLVRRGTRFSLIRIWSSTVQKTTLAARRVINRNTINKALVAGLKLALPTIWGLYFLPRSVSLIFRPTRPAAAACN